MNVYFNPKKLSFSLPYTQRLLNRFYVIYVRTIYPFFKISKKIFLFCLIWFWSKKILYNQNFQSFSFFRLLNFYLSTKHFNGPKKSNKHIKNVVVFSIASPWVHCPLMINGHAWTNCTKLEIDLKQPKMSCELN